jgi:hypothetical protein
MPLFTSDLNADVPGQIADMAAKATPVAADLVVIEDSDAANAKKKATLTSLIGAVVGSGVSEVNATDAPTTTSLTDVLLPGMTITPPPGQYMAIHTGAWSGSASAVIATFSFYVNGVQVSDSERPVRVTAGGASMSAVVIKMVTVAAGAVEVRWRASAGTLTSGKRNLILHRHA